MAAACVAASVCAGPARAADVVVTAGGAERRVDEGALRAAADVPAGVVVLRSQPGPGEVIAHPPAVSLPRVLELAGVAPGALSFVSVRRPNGTVAAIRADDLAAAPPIVWLDADSVRFYRPPRDDADLNAADNFATAGDDLAVRVRQGALLDVQVRVQPVRPRAGERVRLEAQVTGAPEGSAIVVRWRFGDGAGGAGAAAAHRWRRPGTYAVVASAEGDDDSAGASVPVLVQVGERRRPEREEDPGRGDADPEQAPATGPDSGAPGAAAPPGPDAGAPGAAAPPAPDAGASDAAAPPAPDASAPTPAATPPPDPEVGGSPAGPRVKQRERPAGRDVPPAPQQVEGVLVAATLPADAEPAPAPAGRAGRDVAGADLTYPLAGLAACGLVGLGAFRERRRRRP